MAQLLLPEFTSEIRCERFTELVISNEVWTDARASLRDKDVSEPRALTDDVYAMVRQIAFGLMRFAIQYKPAKPVWVGCNDDDLPF